MRIRIHITAYLIFGFAISINIQSQTPQQNLEKYWNYRTRFFDKFIYDADYLHSPRSGINLPASVYNPYENQGRDNTVSWGDTEIGLSEYVGAMATEYQILKLHNQNLDNVKSKIHRGLTALERLDWIAEQEYGCGPYDIDCEGTTSRNGFFLRDDMSQYIFEWHGDHDKNEWYEMDLKSDYKNMELEDGDNVMSQDMFWNLLMGYSLVTYYLPEDDEDKYPGYDCKELTLRDRAIDQVYLMHRFMFAAAEVINWHPVIYGGVGYPGYWILGGSPPFKIYRIINPCTNETVPHGGSWSDLEPFTKYFRDASNIVTQWEYGDMYWYFTAYPGDIIPYPVTNNFYNDVGRLITSAITNAYFASDLDEFFKNIRKHADFWNQNVSGNPFDMKYFLVDHLPMLNVLLWDHHPTNNIWNYYYSHVEQLLNEAPPDGPKSLVFPPTEYIWSSSSIFQKPYGDIITSQDDDRLVGEYSGLDYMLLFNLFHLTYDQCFNDPVTISNDFPTIYTYDSFGLYSLEYGDRDIDIGHEANSAIYTIHSKDEIKMNSTVHSNGKIRLVGNTISLEAGFEVESGGEFIAESNKCMDLDFTPPVGNYKSATSNSTSKYPPVNANDNIVTELENDSYIKEHLLIYPNPATEIITINSNSKIELISIYNSKGKMICQMNSHRETYIQIDLSEYTSGLYFISAVYSDGDVEYKKLIKE